jgi:hypothetical protein
MSGRIMVFVKRLTVMMRSEEAFVGIERLYTSLSKLRGELSSHGSIYQAFCNM